MYDICSILLRAPVASTLKSRPSIHASQIDQLWERGDEEMIDPTTLAIHQPSSANAPS